MYLLDANVFIEAKRNFLTFELAPGFWNWIHQSYMAGRVFSVEPVQAELVGRGDDLSIWVRSLPKGFFLASDASAMRSMAEVARWANGCPDFTSPAVNEFLGVADSHLVAHALVHGWTVVTLEATRRESSKIRIPNACTDLKVKCLKPNVMLKDEGVTFAVNNGSQFIT